MAIPYTIRAHPLLAGLPEQDKNSLLAGGKVKSFSAGRYLYHHGDTINYFYIISDGTIKLFRENQTGNEITIDVLIAGGTLGEGEILESFSTYQSNAICMDEVTVIQFPAKWLRDSAQKSGTFALNLLASVAREARLSEIEVEHQATMSAAQLVACFMQRICVLHDFNPSGFDLPYSKTLIASRLGMELETFSRTLTKLKDHGVTVAGSHVCIHNPRQVAQYVCGQCSIAHECPTQQAIELKISN